MMTTTMTKTATLDTIEIRIVSPGEDEHWHISGVLMDILVLAVLNRTLSVRLPFSSTERYK